MDIWQGVEQQRRDIADHLSGLTDDQWDGPSLCEEWRIRDVLGHITAGATGAYGFRTVVPGLARHGFNFSRWMAADGKQRGRQDPAVILSTLRENAGSHAKPPGAPPMSVLCDVMIHGQDMCRPLGITRELPEEELRAVGDFARTAFVFDAKKRTAGLCLRATDMDWTAGDGPEVSGPGEALLMAMAGRRAALADLGGEGQPILAARF
ncbi:MAG TPA: maleylpyruvate isomerase family mycothiol-dependent enzyme [Acidimicrobiales bacterium]|jgi:uncharacterized protein (TIGR03083 family)|nr:maleylpyruvate isomerase family mycothiol-dependent enzyme [Acidimicrobiales bacterium]